MAPMKFEDKLREQLEERQLQPSTDAWNKLSEQLDTHETTRNEKAYWWLGIAASLVGVLMLVTFLNKDVTETPAEPVLVDTEENSSPINVNKENNIQVVEENLQEEEVIDKENPIQKEEKQTTNQPTLKKRIQVEQQKLIPKDMEEVVAEVVKEMPQDEKLKEPLSFEEQKAKEVVAQIRALQNTKEVVADAEIDALLNAAQKEIELKKLYNEAANKVDANALLQSVEDDLERSFRARVFEMLSSGYQELKTAVAERNN
jgi:hypothetical protein